MASFDVELWRQRALTRYDRALRAGCKRQAAIERLDTDYIHIAQLNTLIDWCTSKTIDVDFGNQAAGRYVTEQKKIKINGRLSPEKQVFFMLHECGHHLIGNREKHERFGMGYPQDDPKIRRTFHHKCDIVDEELEAWHRGWRLAKRLKLRVKKHGYDKMRATSMKSYFKWALGEFKDEELDGKREDVDE